MAGIVRKLSSGKVKNQFIALICELQSEKRKNKNRAGRIKIQRIERFSQITNCVSRRIEFSKVTGFIGATWK